MHGRSDTIRSHRSPHIEVIFFMAISNFKQPSKTEQQSEISSAESFWTEQNGTEQRRTELAMDVDVAVAPKCYPRHLSHSDPIQISLLANTPGANSLSWPQSRAENIQTIRICVLINKFACENHFDCWYQTKLVSDQLGFFTDDGIPFPKSYKDG